VCATSSRYSNQLTRTARHKSSTKIRCDLAKDIFEDEKL
jgi:hypothetical protein